jgi:hypothetical protein
MRAKNEDRKRKETSLSPSFPSPSIRLSKRLGSNSHRVSNSNISEAKIAGSGYTYFGSIFCYLSFFYGGEVVDCGIQDCDTV